MPERKADSKLASRKSFGYKWSGGGGGRGRDKVKTKVNKDVQKFRDKLKEYRVRRDKKCHVEKFRVSSG